MVENGDVTPGHLTPEPGLLTTADSLEKAVPRRTIPVSGIIVAAVVIIIIIIDNTYWALLHAGTVLGAVHGIAH